MAKPKIFITRRILPEGFNLLQEHCEIDLWPEELPPSRQIILERVRGVDGLLCLLTDRIDGEVMEAAGPGLKVISNHAVGFDNIDLPAATQRRLPVGNTPGILTDSTADFAFALIMAAARRLVEGDRAVRDGRWKTWSPDFMLGPDISGATLGIVGYGRIGPAVARRARGFAMRILYHAPSASAPFHPGEPQPVDLDTLLAESDFVSIHTPLSEATRRLVDAVFFAHMKPTAILINTARGPIVDQEALYQALQTRRITAAAIDVTDPEPLPLDSPLLTLDNLLITPHIASASTATRAKMSLMAAQNLVAGVRGERLPNCVNPEVYG